MEILALIFLAALAATLFLGGLWVKQAEAIGEGKAAASRVEVSSWLMVTIFIGLFVAFLTMIFG